MIYSITNDAIILLSRGGYSAAPRRQVERLTEAVRASGRYTLVLAAMVDQGEPSLPEALDACAQAGAQRAIVLPLFLPGDANLQIWLAKVARRWQAAQPESAMAVTLAAGLGDHPALDTALLAALTAAEAGSDVAASPPPNWERDPAGWNVLPAHQHHVLTCRGPRCTALGADACWQRLRDSLTEHGLRGAEDRVLVAATGCLYPCNRGPVLVAYPDGVWYGDLTPEVIEALVVEHLVGGAPLEAQRIVPGQVKE
jgi:(2Fe-2S) ferredoxin